MATSAGETALETLNWINRTGFSLREAASSSIAYVNTPSRIHIFAGLRLTSNATLGSIVESGLSGAPLRTSRIWPALGSDFFSIGMTMLLVPPSLQTPQASGACHPDISQAVHASPSTN